MAVDIKTLRIGSHVEHEGKRVRVEQVSTIRLSDKPIEVIVSQNKRIEAVCIDGIQPILITPELLKELGFNCIGHGSFEHWFLGNFDLTHNIGSRYWDYKDDIRLEYLHELEDLYYLIYGVELIND